MEELGKIEKEKRKRSWNCNMYSRRHYSAGVVAKKKYKPGSKEVKPGCNNITRAVQDY